MRFFDALLLSDACEIRSFLGNSCRERVSFVRQQYPPTFETGVPSSSVEGLSDLRRTGATTAMPRLMPEFLYFYVIS